MLTGNIETDKLVLSFLNSTDIQSIHKVNKYFQRLIKSNKEYDFYTRIRFDNMEVVYFTTDNPDFKDMKIDKISKYETSISARSSELFNPYQAVKYNKNYIMGTSCRFKIKGYTLNDKYNNKVSIFKKGKYNVAVIHYMYDNLDEYYKLIYKAHFKE